MSSKEAGVSHPESGPESLSIEERKRQLRDLQDDYKKSSITEGSSIDKMVKEKMKDLEDSIVAEEFPGLIDVNKEAIQDEMKRLQEEFEETNRKSNRRSKKTVAVPGLEPEQDGVQKGGSSAEKILTPEVSTFDKDENDFKSNGQQFRFKSWEGYSADQLKYALNFVNQAVQKGKISEDLGIYGKDISEEGKRFGNQQEAVDDLVARMEARLSELESAGKKRKTPEPRPDVPNPVIETPTNTENTENTENTPPSPEVPAPVLEVPGAKPIPDITAPEKHDDTPPDPEQMEPKPEVKQTIEVKDAAKLRAMYEAADREEQKNPRWGWLKERMKGMITAGWWESHVAESFRTGTKQTAKEADARMQEIMGIADGSIKKDIIDIKRQRIAELQQRLAYTEIQLARFSAEAENPATKKNAQPENVIKQLGFEVDNIKREIEKREKELAELEEQRKRQNQEVIRSLTVHGLEGFEHYVLTLSTMPEGATKQRALENLTTIMRILDGVEENLRSSLGKHRGGLLKRIFGEEDKTYRGAELLSEDKIARVKRDIFERCIAIQQGQVAKDAESVKTIIRKNLDPEWWKRYVATGVEAVLAGLAIKFALGYVNNDYGALTIETHPPIVAPSGAESIGMHKTVWGTTKKYLIDKCGIPNPTDAQVMDASKTVLKQNGLYEKVWQFVQGAKSSRVLPEGYKLLMNKADILASIGH